MNSALGLPICWPRPGKARDYTKKDVIQGQPQFPRFTVGLG